MIFEGDDVKEIDRYLETLSIPLSVKYISPYACFNGRIKILNLKDLNIKIIDKYAFSHCFSLIDAIFPPSIEEIREAAFKNCIYLQYIEFYGDSKLRVIGSETFYGCNGLESFNFPPRLEFIGDNAFNECVNIELFNFSETKVKRIGKRAFANIEAEIILPKSISTQGILENSYNDLYVDEKHEFIKYDENGYYHANKLIFNGFKQMKFAHIRRGVEIISNYCFIDSLLVSLSIPASVKIISFGSFLNCKKLKNVSFHANSQLKEIKMSAFQGCTCIKKVHFPKSLKIIRSNAFNECYSLQSVSFPVDSQLERIEEAFPNTNIKHLSLPSSTREIHDVVCKMYQLESIFIENDLYKSNNEETAIYSRDGSELVCVIPGLTKFMIPNNVRVIKEQAFFASRLDGEFKIPASVEIIEDNAFFDCNSLYFIFKFENGSRLKSLGSRSLPPVISFYIEGENFVKKEENVFMSINPTGILFFGKQVNEFDFPKNVEVIYSFAFGLKNCCIKKIKFPKSLKKIDSFAFHNQNCIHVVEFEEGSILDYIETGAFLSTSIRNISLPQIKYKLGLAFGYLNFISFPSNFNPTEISNKVFHDNQNMKIICPRSSISTLAKIDFICTDLVEIIDS